MTFEFDINNQVRLPLIKLCKPNLVGMGFLNVHQPTITEILCDTNELTFTIYENDKNYDNVLKYMVLDVEDKGYYEIANVSENNDGASTYKEVTAYGYEVTLKNSSLTFVSEDGNPIVWQLFDVVGDKPEITLFTQIEKYTGWKCSHCDASLLSQGRTMEIDNVSAYELMMNNIAETFKCYFVFDTINKTFVCYDRNNEPKIAKMNLGFSNFIENIRVSNVSDDVVTALTVKGSEGVGISLVNPIGTDEMYDFSYFFNKPFGMDASLTKAVKLWQDLVESYTEPYRKLVVQKREKDIVLDEKKMELELLKTELNQIKDAQSIAIQNNNNDRLAELKPEYDKTEADIAAKEVEIKQIESEFAEINQAMSHISTSLSFAENFSQDQRKELEYFIKTGIYENDNFIFTDSMSEQDKIDWELQLYELGKQVHAKVKQPQYEFEAKIQDFFMSKKYTKFIKEIELGKAVNTEVKKDNWVCPRIVKIFIDYENVENSTITFSDKFYIEGGAAHFIDIFEETTKVSGKVTKMSALWDEPVSTGFYSKVNEYLKSTLSLANQEIVNATNQEFTMGTYGLRGRKTTDTGYDNHQIAITNNVIAFTDDGWQSCRAALGNITFAGNDYYGLAAEAIIGNFLVSEKLVISNGDSATGKPVTFRVDANGATLTNADFTVSNATTKIEISPTAGITIKKKNSSGGWDNTFYTDTDGRIKAYDITLIQSNVGGWITESTRLSSPNGVDYIGSDGTGQLGLMTWGISPTEKWANFEGNIYAHNLHWQYDNKDYGSLFSWNDALGGIVLVGGFGDDMPLYNQAEIRYGSNTNNLARIYSKKDNISTQAPDQESIYIESLVGNIHLNCLGDENLGNHVSVKGGLTTDTLAAGKSTFNGDVIFNSSATFDGKTDFKQDMLFNGNVEFGQESKFDTVIFKKDVEVDKNFKAAQLESNNYVICSNFKSNNPYNAVGFECTVQFNGNVLTAKNGSTHLGSTKTVTVDGVTLQFVNGLLVN